MSVGIKAVSELASVRGVSLASTHCGIKYTASENTARHDLVIMQFVEGSVCASTFTQNAFCAAPVVVARNNLKLKQPRYFLINSGNANAGTGQQGLADAVSSCRKLADTLHCSEQEVLPFSTGVIGEPLPMEKLNAGIEQAAKKLDANNWLQAANAIMTTDTVAKGVSEQVELNGECVTLTGIAKGSGMIHPDMATMLCFIATDANIDGELLQSFLSQAVENSFNSITVDGDTSTNDACMLVATRQSKQEIIADTDAAIRFSEAVEKVCLQLAQSIIRDGEGATKFVSVKVQHARSASEAKQVAYTIALSPLVKTALFASDPNWGRILAAVGRAGVDNLDINGVNIFLDDVCIVTKGGKNSGYTEEQGQQVMDQAEITILVELGRGNESATVWTTDLSHDYVSINSDYRS